MLDADETVLPYDFNSAAELLSLCKQNDLRVSQLMMENEKAWRSEEEIRAGLLKLWHAMQECVNNGLKYEGTLPGGSTCDAVPPSCTAACRSSASPM